MKSPESKMSGKTLHYHITHTLYGNYIVKKFRQEKSAIFCSVTQGIKPS